MSFSAVLADAATIDALERERRGAMVLDVKLGLNTNALQTHFAANNKGLALIMLMHSTSVRVAEELLQLHLMCYFTTSPIIDGSMSASDLNRHSYCVKKKKENKIGSAPG